MDIREKHERFSQLLRILYEVRDGSKHFDIKEWAINYDNTCQTTACAIGWAAMDPWFNARGLRLGVHRMPVIIDLTPPNYGEYRETYRRWFAVMKFFNISNETAYNLFAREGTIDEVIQRIKVYLESISIIQNKP